MNKTFFKIGLGLLVLTSMVRPSYGAITGMKALSGHVPSVVSQLAPAGRLAATTNLYLTIGLPLRNQEILTNLIQDLYNPASPNYKHFLSPDEFTDQFGPTTNDYKAVLDFAATNGLTVVHTHHNRMLVDVQGKVSDVERAFHVQMNTYHHPKEARDFYAPNTEPTVDARVPVLAVQGINNYVLPRSMVHKIPVSGAKSSLGTGPNGSYMGQDFRNAYVPGTPLNGTGQVVGLLQFDGYFTSDIQTYESLAGLPNVPLQNVLLDGFNGAPGAGNDEVCLDIEMSISMAPGLSKVVVFEAGPFGNPDDILNSMASSNTIKQLSSSWGYSIDASTVQIYIEFLVQGQTYLNCSGDGDAWVGAIPFGSVENQFVTVVGGTTLTMNGSGASYASERAWNAGNNGDFNWNPDGFEGSSGGISTDLGIPFYQVGINMTTNQGSANFRNVPDVALTADNIFLVSSGGSLAIANGTSAATPLWAGYMALLNQQAAANGGSSIGFLNPTVYALARTTNYANCFHDIITGDNTWDQSLTKFFAVPGYDLCTGLGTPNGVNLISALTGTNGVPIVYNPVIPAPLQPWGNALSVMDGANPNGLWFLYYRDEKQNGFFGTNYNGWMVNLTTAYPVGFNGDNELYVNTTVNTQPYGAVTNVNGTPGSSWHTTLAVTNYGPSISSNVTVVDTLPLAPGLILVSSNSSILGSTITMFGNKLTWNAGNLAVNAGGTLTLNMQVNNTGVYVNAATVNAATTDPNPDDDSIVVTANISVSTPPVLSPHLASGGSHGFQLTITNDAGANIIIQASTNLFNWVPVTTNLSPFTFTNFDTTNYQMRFYRAVVEQ